MNFIRNRNFRAGPQTSLEGFICPQNSDKQQKNKVFGRSGGAFCLLIILGSLLVGYVVIKLSYYIIHRVVLSEKKLWFK